MDMNKIVNKDLYELFDVPFKSSPADIRKAYRKKALECHPDKNPDNPKAAELFNELTEALKILLDEAARAAYDKILEARKAAKLRHRELDDRRKRFKADLEAREEAYLNNKQKQKSDEERLREEIARLQKEGAKLLEETLVEEEIARTFNKNGTETGVNYKIKVQWTPMKNEDGEPVYTKEILERIFHKYGDIAGLVFSEKKGKGKGLVEFREKSAAELAMKLELGLMKCPLKLKWMNQESSNKKIPSVSLSSDSLVTERDYESLVLRKMRQAEERKRLIEELQKEDAD